MQPFLFKPLHYIWALLPHMAPKRPVQSTGVRQSAASNPAVSSARESETSGGVHPAASSGVRQSAASNPAVKSARESQSSGGVHPAASSGVRQSAASNRPVTSPGESDQISGGVHSTDTVTLAAALHSADKHAIESNEENQISGGVHSTDTVTLAFTDGGRIDPRLQPQLVYDARRPLDEVEVAALAEDVDILVGVDMIQTDAITWRGASSSGCLHTADELDFTIDEAYRHGAPLWHNPGQGGSAPSRRVHDFFSHKLRHGARIDMYRGEAADDLQNREWKSWFSHLPRYQSRVASSHDPQSLNAVANAMELVAGLSYTAYARGSNLPEGHQVMFPGEDARESWERVWHLFVRLGLTVTVQDAGQSSSSPPLPKPSPPPIRSVVQSAGPPDARIRLQSAKQMQEHILHPLCKAVGGNFPEWIRPQSLIVGGSDVALEHLHEAFDVDWRRVIPASGSLQVEAWAVAFYDEEPDPTPPLWPDRPRLDIVVTFTDGNWVRWHPKAKLIWSTDLMPTDAMRCRMNRKAKLLKSR